MKKKSMNLFLRSISALIFLMAFAGIAAASCWDNDYDQTACQADDSCEWQDPWCQEKGCWNYFNEDGCDNSNMSCQWYTGNAMGWCEDIGCWNYDNTNQTACESASGLDCTWNTECFGPWEKGCWEFSDSTSCASAGCDWGGMCFEKGCNQYSSSSTCLASSEDCAWNSEWDYCYEAECWDYSDNESDCDSAPDGLGCLWDSNGMYCYEPSCWSYDYDQTGCEDSGLNCQYNDPWCEEQGCWSNGDSDSCSVAGCNWRTDNFNTGWCGDVGCWSFDNITYPGTANETGCVNNSFGLDCLWEPDGGWCWEDITFSCSNYDDNQKGCFDTGFCIWEFLNSTCIEPQGGFEEFEFNNPSCSIFDFDGEACEKITGCTNVTDGCSGNPEGITCANITDQDLCNKITHLSTCCQWAAGTCEVDYSTACWDNMQSPPEGASFCEDYNAYTSQDLCQEIAGDPWYMPCTWDADDEHCEFAGSNDFFEINTKSECDFAGGMWREEFYCEGTQQVKDTWCEMNFGFAASNCDQSCWACEFAASGGPHADATAAQSACENSKLGNCQWKPETYAPNGYGFCEEPFLMSYGGICNNENCWACTNTDECNGAQCKWFGDYCDAQNVKTCSEDCFSCMDSDNCVTNGGGSAGTCSWEDNICKPKGYNQEICFDGVDNDDDGDVDCADSNCMTDPFCGGNFMSDCMGYPTNATCLENGCIWMSDQWEPEGWCDMPGSNCWQYDENLDECSNITGCKAMEGQGFCDINFTYADSCLGFNSSECAANSDDCSWMVDPWMENDLWCIANPEECGWCDSKIFECMDDPDRQANSTVCEADGFCRWDDMGGYGPGMCSDPCHGPMISPETCGNNSPMCIWKTGGCVPEMMGGSECFVYDNNESACIEQNSTCMWHEEDGFCDIDFGEKHCPMYWDNESCSNASGCIWMEDPMHGGFFCEHEAFACEALDEGGCNADSTCMWDGYWCQPACFNHTLDEGGCNIISGCEWRSGFCDPIGMGMMFVGMQEGPPIPLGNDDCGETGISGSNDICFIGLKDMPDNFGFGIGVESMSDSAICNGVNLGDGQSGYGSETSDYYIYLDTDGSETGGCALKHNSNLVGYEFQFRYETSYENGSLSETHTAYKCIDNNWAIADISLSSWQQKMCTELNGGMISVPKTALNKLTTLYDPTKVMRIFGATSNSTNISSPVDTIGPVYFTQGTIDFMFEDCMKKGVDMDGDGLVSENDPDCFMFNKFGFIPTEDCFPNGIDEDNDGLVDCNDNDCYGMPICDGEGVNAEGYVDNIAPSIMMYNVEVFPDSAFITYDSDEPANGTVQFYYDDSTCTTINKTVYDIGIMDPYMPDYKNWHDGPLDNFAFNPQALGYDLESNTSYYYKLKLCDPSGNCAVSACWDFMTAESFDNCPACDVTFKFDMPGDWGIKWDFGEGWETQGESCGENAGMQGNYSSLRNSTMMFDLPDEDAGIQFNNMNPTKSALTDDVTNIGDGDILSGNTDNGMGYVGLNSSTAEKLNRMQPGFCTIKVPKGTDGTCDALYHCDDSIDNCVDRSGDTDVELLNSSTTYCEWKIPCDFSVWTSGDPEASDTSSSDDSSSTSRRTTSGGIIAAPFSSNITATTSRMWASLAKGDTMAMAISKANISITGIHAAVKSDLSRVTMKVSSLKENPGPTAPSGKIYQYLEIMAENVVDSDFDSTRIEFQIEKAWLMQNGINKADIRLYRYSGSWQEFATNIVAEGIDMITFDAAVPGFSYFAIGAKTVVVPEAIEELPESAPEVEASPVIAEPSVDKPVEDVIIPPGEDSDADTWINWKWVTLVLIVLVCSGVIYFVLKKPKW